MCSKKRIVCNLILVMLCIACLAGCGNKGVEYGNDSRETGTQEENPSDSSASEEAAGSYDSSMAKRLKADKEWQAEWICEEQNKLKVNAVVTLPEEDTMQVLKAKQKTYTNEERKKIAEYLLDKDSIAPVSYGNKYVTKKDLADAIEQKKAHIESSESYYSSEEFVSRQFDWKKWLEYLRSEVEELEKQYEDFAEADLNDYSWGAYSGTINGTDYTLFFEETERMSYDDGTESSDVFYKPVLNLIPTNLSYPEATKDGVDVGAVGENIGKGARMCPVRDLEFGENKAAMTKEQAREQAYRICDDLNIEGMEVKSVSDMGWWHYNETGEINMGEYEALACDGYVVTMERKINGAFVSDKNMRTNYGIDPEDLQRVIEPEILNLYLKDDGIVAITLPSYMEVVETMTDNTELLQFEQVKPILEEAALRKYNGSYDSIFFDNMELTYMCIGDLNDKETFYFVPIWQLYASIGIAMDAWYAEAYGVEPEVLYGVVINAIDGSEIDLEKRVSLLELKKKFEEEQAE